MPPLAQVHTLDITHKISQMEVERIKRKYKIAKDEDIKITDTGSNGLNEIFVRKNPVYKDGVFIKSVYTLEAQVNVSKVINHSSVAMVDISHKNMSKLIGRLQEIFMNQIQLDIRNCNMENWVLVRLDAGFDLKIPYGKLAELDGYMRLLNHSLNLENNRHCSYYKYKGYDSEEKRTQSIALLNSLYKYNIYYKRKELILKGKRFKSLDDWDVTDGVIRFEKQMESKKISKVVGSPQKLGLLLDETVSNRIFSDVQSDLELFFGSGKYVAYGKGIEIINRSRYGECMKQYMRIVYTAATNYGFQDFLMYSMKNGEKWDMDSDCVRKTILDARRNIESLGISVAGLQEDEVQMIRKDALPNINQLVRQIKVDKDIKREKSSFAKIYPEGSRFRCNPTLHDFNGKGVRKSLAGKNVEELEETIAKNLYLSLKRNIAQVVEGDVESETRIVLQSLEEFKGFMGQAESQKVREVIGTTITRLTTYLNDLNEFSRRDVL